MPVFQNVKATIEITPGAGQGRLWFTVDAGPGDNVKTYAELGAWLGEKAASVLDLLHSGPRSQEIADLKARLAKAPPVVVPAQAPEPAPVKSPREYRRAKASDR